MKIIRAYPPNFVDIVRAGFPVKGRQGLLFAWGDRLYNPSGIEVPPWLMAHEEVHGHRQKPLFTADGSIPRYEPETWWEIYLRDPNFRLEEEVLAHQVEWEAFSSRGQGGSIENQARYLQAMVERLSGPLYGRIVSPQQAEDLILRR